jgi:hypothetical protein
MPKEEPTPESQRTQREKHGDKIKNSQGRIQKTTEREYALFYPF